jgi:RNA polymerase sigma-70 factor, ECF subfamily
VYSPITMERHSSTQTEAEMIAAILAGDTQLYHELIHPHERCVYLMALSLMKNETDAEDIAQEAFLKAFRNLSTFRAESRFGTWLDDAPDGGGVVSPALLRDWREIPSEVVERQEIRQMLQEAVISLPTIYREVFQLRDVEDLNVKETAEALGISVPSVKVRLHRARMMLQKQLSPLLKNVNPSAKRRWLPWL